MDRTQTEALARLAKLKFTPGELELFAGDMGSILEFVNRLSELKTEGVPPASHVSGVVNVLREDEVAPSMPREEVLQGAPERDESGFIIPRVI